MTSRSYVFTCFRNTEYRPTITGDVKYIICQLEECSETGRTHLQGYIEFTKAVRYTAVQRILDDNTAHVEKRKGSREQARAYCSKLETRIDGPWECGAWSKGQGERTDLQSACDSLLETKSLDQLADSHPVAYIKYTKGFQSLLYLKRKADAKSWRQLEVKVYWGEAGSGKTREAVAITDSYFILDKISEQMWFDGYDGEDHLIVDDFYGWIKFNNFLRLCDGYPYRCPIKGGMVWASWTKVTFTSNKHPDTWYDQTKLNDAQINAFHRRIHEIKEF